MTKQKQLIGCINSFKKTVQSNIYVFFSGKLFEGTTVRYGSTLKVNKSVAKLMR